MSVSFSIRFDTRSKEILLESLRSKLSIAEIAICSGDYSDSALIQYEETLQLFRGILYAKPESQTEVDTTKS